MESPNILPLPENVISRFDTVMDVVVKDTRLIKVAQSLGKTIIHGKTMTTYQAEKQFKIYTGQSYPKH